MPCTFKTKDGEHPCQFNVPEDELIQVSDNTQWCEYHCPMEITENDQTIETEKADWSDAVADAFNEKIIALIKEGVKNERMTNLVGVVFPKDISFSNLSLHKCNYSQSVFCEKVWFTKAIFSDNTYFDHVRFGSETEFWGYISFNEATFSRITWFINTTFIGSVDFKRTKFKGMTWFNKAKFISDVFFYKTFFGSYADFKYSVFNEFSNFSEVTFDSNADFNNVKFLGETNFRGGYQTNNYFNYISFKHAIFDKKSNFNNRIFRSSTCFSNCSFEKSPSFHNSELHQDTDFEGARFEDTQSDSAARDYRTLKLAMEKHRARDEQSMFYALEQQSLRHQSNTPYWVKISSYLYELTSNYGQSALRPLVGLLLLGLSFRLIYSSLIMYHFRLMHAAELWEFTILQIVSPFSAWSEKSATSLKQLFGDSLLFVKLLASLHSILGLTFLALLLLAIRWKFRRG